MAKQCAAVPNFVVLMFGVDVTWKVMILFNAKI